MILPVFCIMNIIISHFAIMKAKKFIEQFPIISEQEKLLNELMDHIEGKGCVESCSQGCVKKNLKNNKKG